MIDYLSPLEKLSSCVVETQSDSIIIKLELSQENREFIAAFDECNFIENIRNSHGDIINLSQLGNFENDFVLVEIVSAQIKKVGYYTTLNDFIISNRFQIPEKYFILEIKYSSENHENVEIIEKYKAITTLINRLETKAKFKSDGEHKILYIFLENTFLELPIDSFAFENYFGVDSLNALVEFIDYIDSYKEKRNIYIKELIDFLKDIEPHERFKYLISNFNLLFERCNASFEYYLSNFSFNKVKLELDNSVLEFSKSIRAIINDSQTRLIAIPAAFVLSTSQIDFDNAATFKNLITVISTFLFSYIVSLFINNQKNALVIISDNLENYKSNYSRSKITEFEQERELVTLSQLINNSYLKTEIELKSQKQKLMILQYCNWGVSFSMLIILIFLILKELYFNYFY